MEIACLKLVKFFSNGRKNFGGRNPKSLSLRNAIMKAEFVFLHIARSALPIIWNSKVKPSFRIAAFLILYAERQKAEGCFHRYMDSDKFSHCIHSLDNADDIGRLYDQFAQMLYKIIYSIVRDRQDAEDTLQEVFISVWQRSVLFDEQKGSLGAWLIRIARNRAIDRTRSKQYRHQNNSQSLYSDGEEIQFEAPAISVIDHLSRKDEASFVQQAFSRLNGEQQKIIDLMYFQGYTQSEIADEFKIPLGTVKTRARLAMKRMRDALAPLYYERTAQ